MSFLSALQQFPTIAMRARRGWDRRATWLRLVYGDPAPVQAAVNRLSRHTDRIGLRWRDGEGGRILYVGLAGQVLVEVLADMAADWGFQVTAAMDLRRPWAPPAVLHRPPCYRTWARLAMGQRKRPLTLTWFVNDCLFLIPASIAVFAIRPLINWPDRPARAGSYPA
jgi:hypothetical protein